MDAATRRNLEITQNLAGGMENTLASVLDSTVTPMGSRMLKRWLHMPIRNTETLIGRQQTIAALQDRYTELQPVLRQVGDLERILARLALRTARPRDLAGTARSAGRDRQRASAKAARNHGRIYRASRTAGTRHH